MKRTSLLLGGGAAALLICTVGTTFGSRMMQMPALPDHVLSDGSTTLPNGWRLKPAGTPVALPGDMPLTMLLSPDGKYLLVNTAGSHDHSVNVIDLATEKCVQNLRVANDWMGMCLSPDGRTVYVSSGGAGNKPKADDKTANPGKAEQKDASEVGPLLRFQFADGRLTSRPGLSVHGLDDTTQYVSGVACGPDGTLYVANMKNDAMYRCANAATPVVSAPAGEEPYGVALAPDAGTLGVSDWVEGAVRLLDAKTLKQTARIAVGSHPNQLLWGKDGRLFVANAGSNSVSVIDKGAVTETIKTSLAPGDLVGSTPDAIALSPDGKRLYVANADNNDVAVVDISDAKESRILGFLPTGWYPSALAVSADGRKLFIGTAKGLTFRSNAPEHVDHAADIARQQQKFEYK